MAEDIQEAIKEMFADVLEEVLHGELDAKLGYDKQERRILPDGDGLRNYHNGSSKKLVKTQFSEVEISVPRDRNGEFEPQILGKYQRNASGFEEKILSGMSIRYIIEGLHRQYRKVTRVCGNFRVSVFRQARI